MTTRFKKQKVKLKGKAWDNQKQKVYDRDNHTCQLCGRDVVVCECHHAIFRSQGGDDSMENLITLCFSCHHAIHNGCKDATKLRRLAERKLEEINGKAL